MKDNDDGSWQLDEFEATSDDEGGILIVPVSDDAGNNSAANHNGGIALYIPNENLRAAEQRDSSTQPSLESERVTEEEEEGDDEEIRVVEEEPNQEKPRSQVEQVIRPHLLGPPMNPRNLVVITIALMCVTALLLCKSFFDLMYLRKLEKAVQESESIRMAQIRALHEENEKLARWKECWSKPASCGANFLSKKVLSVSKSAADSVDHKVSVLSSLLANVTSFLVPPYHEYRARIESYKQQCQSQEFASIAEAFHCFRTFATERLESVKNATQECSAALSDLKTNRSSLLKPVKSLLTHASVGAGAWLLVTALFQYEPFVGGEV